MSHYAPHHKPKLQPLAWLYRLVVGIRNKLFDWNIFTQVEFPQIPIICVGNLSVGGTGKTPHVEYLIRLLQERYKVAVVSRGYKRKTKGFLLANAHTNSFEMGDEPYQMMQKFPRTLFAIDSNRRRSIRRLLELPTEQRPDVILMDDGFQHRWVKPSYVILLSDYNYPVYEDYMLPVGRLREPVKALERANIVLATKCPSDIKPIDMRIASNHFALYPYQSLMFTTMKYGELQPVYNRNGQTALPLQALKNKKVLLIAGIANPVHLQQKLQNCADEVHTLEFPDHHNFSQEDINMIVEKLKQLPKDERIAITTEKDKVRLATIGNLPDILTDALFYLPIEVAFLSESEQVLFNKKIQNHVRKNSRNSQLHSQ